MSGEKLLLTFVVNDGIDADDSTYDPSTTIVCRSVHSRMWWLLGTLWLLLLLLLPSITMCQVITTSFYESDLHPLSDGEKRLVKDDVVKMRAEIPVAILVSFWYLFKAKNQNNVEISMGKNFWLKTELSLSNTSRPTEPVTIVRKMMKRYWRLGERRRVKGLGSQRMTESNVKRLIKQFSNSIVNQLPLDEKGSESAEASVLQELANFAKQVGNDEVKGKRSRSRVERVGKRKKREPSGPYGQAPRFHLFDIPVLPYDSVDVVMKWYHSKRLSVDCLNYTLTNREPAVSGHLEETFDEVEDGGVEIPAQLHERTDLQRSIGVALMLAIGAIEGAQSLPVSRSFLLQQRYTLRIDFTRDPVAVNGLDEFWIVRDEYYKLVKRMVERYKDLNLCIGGGGEEEKKAIRECLEAINKESYIVDKIGVGVALSNLEHHLPCFHLNEATIAKQFLLGTNTKTKSSLSLRYSLLPPHPLLPPAA